MAPARAGDAPAADLALLRDVPAELIDVLVVDLRDLVLAEVTVAPLDGGRRASRPLSLLLLRSLACHVSVLEGDVVVGGLREVGRLGGRAGGNELVASAALGSVAAGSEELDALGDDLHRLALRPVLRVPLAPVQPAVDADGAALAQVLRARLGLVAEDRHVEVVGLVDPLAGLVAAAAVDGDAQAADCGAAGRVPELGILRQVPDEHDTVDVRHLLLLLVRTYVRFRGLSVLDGGDGSRGRGSRRRSGGLLRRRARA